MTVKKPRKKISHCDAKKLLKKSGVDFKKDFFELTYDDIDRVYTMSRRVGYRRRHDTGASIPRMYFQLLKRLKSCKIK